MRKTRILAFVLAVIMIFSIVPVSVFAENAIAVENKEYHVNCDFSDSFSTNGGGYVTGDTPADNGDGSAKIYLLGNGHNYLNVKTTSNNGDQALLFVGSGNPNNAKNGTNICVDMYPTTNKGYTNYDVYQKYKGKSFVVSYDIKPLAQQEGKNQTVKVALFTFCNNYAAEGNTGFIQNGFMEMSLKDGSIYLTSSSSFGTTKYLNAKLEIGKFNNLALHVNVPENTYDFYINGEKILSDVTFLKDAEVNKIGTYDTDNTTLINSTAQNKMDDFLFSYARIARINGWATDEGTNLYELDNAKLYFSEEYLGTGDLNNPPVSANQYREPSSGKITGTVLSNKGTLVVGTDGTGAGISGAVSSPGWSDGNNGDATNGYKNVITIYDGVDGAAGTVINSDPNTEYSLVVDDVTYGKGGTTISNKQNVFKNVIDPVTGTAAVALKKYNAKSYMINAGLVQNEEYWVTKNGTTFTVVSEGTAGAYKAVLTNMDEGNNCQNRNTESNASGKLYANISDRLIVSVNFRWAGNTSIDRLLEPVITTVTFASQSRVSVGATGNLYTNNGSVTLAQLSSDRYYNLQAEYYFLKDKDAETYSMYYDLYLDGLCVAKQFVVKQLQNKTEAELTSNAKNNYGVRYFLVSGVTANANMPAVQEEYIDAVYLRGLYVYKVANTYTNTNLSNSGNTVEGYDLTLGSNLELNYYMNLLPDVKADANAKVVFTIGEEVVAEKNVSEVTPGAKGLYKFTCPVNSTQMATDVKVSIESTTREYKIYMNGVASDEHTYKVVDYAKYILAGEFSAETKALVKAMLNYGAYAQTYFAEKNGAIAGTLANADCAYTEPELNAANFGTGTVTGATEGMTATLVLDTDTVIKIYKDSALIGESAGITADKLDDDVEITVEGGTVKVSVLTLAGKVPAEKTNFKNLAKALALYSQATEAYKAAQ